MGDYFKRVSSLTPTKFWINNVTIKEANMAIEAGAVGCTQNPSYTWKMLNHPTDSYIAKEKLAKILSEEPDDNMVIKTLQRSLVDDIAKIFLPMYEQSNGKDGYVSIQGDPFHEDLDTIISSAHFNREAGKNIMVKVPVTEEGLKAIAILAAEGIPINATECMAVRQVLDVCDVYVEAIKHTKAPAPLYFSLITGIFDQYLHAEVKEKHIDICPDILWQAGLCIAKKVDALIRERNYPVGFIGGGARGLHHFTEMVGCAASITINWIGTADKLIEQNGPVVSRFNQPVPFSVEDELIEKLDTFRKAYFINGIRPSEYEDFGPVVLFRSSFETSWSHTLSYIAEQRSQMKMR